MIKSDHPPCSRSFSLPTVGRGVPFIMKMPVISFMRVSSGAMVCTHFTSDSAMSSSRSFNATFRSRKSTSTERWRCSMAYVAGFFS
jgi:hypothetical protein